MKSLSAPTSPTKSPGSKAESQSSLSKSSIYLRLGILAVLCTPLLIAVLHWLGHDVKLWGCPLKALIGIPCPTWGMTRAVFAISNRQWAAALHHHHLSPLAVVLWAVALSQLSLELLTKRKWSRWWQRRSFWLSSILLLVGYHSGRLYQLWISGALTTSMQQSWLSHLL